jgi:hypothetical protein
MAAVSRCARGRDGSPSRPLGGGTSAGRAGRLVNSLAPTKRYQCRNLLARRKMAGNLLAQAHTHAFPWCSLRCLNL